MEYKTNKRNLLAVIGDEDSVTGLLLAGIGQVDSNQVSNFMVVGPGKLFFHLRERT